MIKDEQLEKERRRLQKELHELQNSGASAKDILKKSRELDDYFAKIQKKMSSDIE